jgi:hypothetical protein
MKLNLIFFGLLVISLSATKQSVDGSLNKSFIGHAVKNSGRLVGSSQNSGFEKMIPKWYGQVRY